MTPTQPHADLRAQLLKRARAKRIRIALEIAEETAAREWVPASLIKDFEHETRRVEVLQNGGAR